MSGGSKFDRVRKPDPRRPRRDAEGKEALYSTAPTAKPSKPIAVSCRRCGLEQHVGVADAARLLLPPALVNPVSGTLWARCPSCGKRSWLDVSAGQALRALLGREDEARRS